MRTKRQVERRQLENLRALPFLAACSDDELRAVDGLGAHTQVADGQRLIREGGGGLEFVVILQGQARVSRRSEELALLGPGSFVGETALLGGWARNATVEAVTPMRIWVFNAGEFAALGRAAPSARAHIERAATGRAAIA